jgi:predicted RND superfamily exporter protein
MRSWLGWVANHPVLVLIAALAGTLWSLMLCVDLRTLTPRLHIDPSAEALLPVHDPERAILEQVRRSFGGDDPVIVAVGFEPSVFTADNLRRIEALTARLRALDGVGGVLSLATAPNLRATDDDIIASSFTEQAREAPAQIVDLQAQLAQNPLYRGTLVSADNRSAAFALDVGAMTADEYAQRGLSERIRAIAAEVMPGAGVHITGTLPVRAATTGAVMRTLRFTVPAVFGVVALLLLATFRSLRAVVVALLVIAAALAMTLATIERSGIGLNLVTTIVPPLVITIGLSYTIHLLAAWFLSRQLIPGAPGPERVLWVMQRIGVGLMLSATTTIVGFLSLLLNPLPAVRQFAVFASFGTLYVALLTLHLMPALLHLGGCSRETPPVAQRLFAKWGARLAEFDVRYRRQIIITAALVVALNVWFATHIRAGADFVSSFDAHSEVRRDFDAVNDAFGGANLLTIFIDTHVDGALADPEQMRPLAELEDWLRRQPEVGAVSSYVDYVELLNRTLNPAAPANANGGALPDSAAAVKQLLVFAGGDTARKMIDPRFRSAVLSVRLKVDGSLAIGAFLSRLDAKLSTLPPAFAARATGSTVLATRAVAAVASGHLASIVIATVVIWLLLSVMFTSARAGFIATLPNLVPVAIYFGTLGLLHISLNPTTSLIACIVLGIAVNDTVHFLARFNADAHATGSEAAALRTAMSAVLRPITLATAALCLGFLAFTGGELRNQAQFGALAAWTLFVAWIADMTLTPALGSRLRIITLWDLLRLDLGARPQQTIPLFAGLSTRQARMFALMSHLENVAVGARLIQQGDDARDIFVIIDGTLEASVERDEGRFVLNTLTRGATLGEAGFFGQRRTASVDAVTPSRILRFDSHDLDRLRVWHPAIAAIIFRNLNSIQAERLARMTSMVHAR